MTVNEQQFMAASDVLELGERDLAPVLAQMQGWLAGLVQALGAARIDTDGLSPASALARLAQSVNNGVKDSEQHWHAQWAALQPAQSLAQVFAGKVMLLVFGKFNAGKSSLCNFLAGRFRLHGRKVQYFHLEGGQIVYGEDGFREGATETTARLQGVCLGERLVLLDTPGLHSATDENAELTQRFLDSADAVLWLTSSTSPGQVQELGELAHELARSKPLLPIVTRSDLIEEDELDGQIVKCLCNKSTTNRAVQEADVLARAQDKLVALQLDPGLLKHPVSVSAHVARQQGQDEDAMAAAGFERLYGALLDIVAPALAYKQRKPAEMLLHHLQEQVMGRLLDQTLPVLAELRALLQAELDTLEARQARIVQMAWREVIPELPALLEQHAQRRDVQAVCDELGQRTAHAFERQARANLGDFVLAPASGVKIELPDATGYDGTADINDDAQSVGYDKLYTALSGSTQALLTDLSMKSVTACGARLQQLAASIVRKEEIVQAHQRQLAEVRLALIA